MTLDLTRAAGDLTRAAGVAMDAVAVARNVDPFDAVVRAVQKGLDTASSVSHQVVVAGGPLSPLPSARSATNRFEVVSVPGARGIALSLGGSRNDLLVAAAAAGLGAYQERLGLPPSELRLAMPAGRHRDGGARWQLVRADPRRGADQRRAPRSALRRRRRNGWRGPAASRPCA